jgi:hypothetical protein
MRTTPAPPKVFERVVGELAFAHIAANGAVAIVGREARETHRTRLHAAHARSVSVLAAHRAGDDLLEVHAAFLEEVLGEIAAMEADGLVRVFAVIVVPIEQGAGCSDASCSACMPTTPQISTSQALDMRFSLIMLITVQGTTPKYSSSEVQH